MSARTLNRFEWLKAVNRSNLLPRAKVIASSLAVEFCNDDTGRLDPGLNTLAQAAGLTMDTVKRGIRDLTEGGWLARTEGRGRGNKTEYTLLSPGKVVAISTTKNRSEIHREKGSSGAPLTKQKGAPMREKGGSSAPSYNKDKQTNEQRGVSINRFKHHQFTGNAFQGLALVSASNHQVLGEWGRWLKAEGYPALSEFPIKRQNAKKNSEFFELPWKRPPANLDEVAEAHEYFSSMIEPEGQQYAAQ